MAETKTTSPLVLTPASVVYSLFLAVMVAYGLSAIFFTGPAMREVAQRQLAQRIADEDRAFCEKFGMRVGSSEFAACSQELAIVRQKQADRDSQAAQSLL
jgi:hypothetical protein